MARRSCSPSCSPRPPLGKGDVITSQGIADYANLLADFIRKV
jgi:hypothetical protein